MKMCQEAFLATIPLYTTGKGEARWRLSGTGGSFVCEDKRADRKETRSEVELQMRLKLEDVCRKYFLQDPAH